VREQASDLNIRAGAPLSLRVHGSLVADGGAPLTASEAHDLVLSAVNAAGVGDQYVNDGEADFAVQTAAGRFRANAYRARGADALVLRRVQTHIPTLAELGLPESIGKLSSLQHGLVLVCGPTGSGKTTTLAALVGQVNDARACHILTIEDPIEFIHESHRASVSQREIHTDTRDFPRALRAGMRQDPDVIMVGEIRDAETMRIALQASETGHLVFASMHASSAAETVNRVLDFFPADEQPHARTVLADSLQAIIIQRLVPSLRNGGREALTEVAIGTTRLKDVVAGRSATATMEAVIADGEYYGMHSFEQDVVSAILGGRISVESGESVVPRPADLQVALKRAGYRGGDV
jgi:twitching motility protein PilT